MIYLAIALVSFIAGVAITQLGIALELRAGTYHARDSYHTRLQAELRERKEIDDVVKQLVG